MTLVNIQLPVFSERITIRQFEPTDITPAYLEWLNDPDLMAFSNQRFATHSKKSSSRYLKKFRGTANKFLALDETASGDMIGTLTIYVSVAHRTADLGILLGNKTYQGRGYAAEAWRFMVENLLEVQGFRKVTAGTLRGNLAMVKILSGSGMDLEGVRVHQELVEGVPMDVLQFARFKSKQ